MILALCCTKGRLYRLRANLSVRCLGLQVFPHHENEIAQSQAAARCSCDADHLVDGKDFVRYWVHNGFVNVDSEKMCVSTLHPLE